MRVDEERISDFIERLDEDQVERLVPRLIEWGTSRDVTEFDFSDIGESGVDGITDDGYTLIEVSKSSSATSKFRDDLRGSVWTHIRKNEGIDTEVKENEEFDDYFEKVDQDLEGYEVLYFTTAGQGSELATRTITPQKHKHKFPFDISVYSHDFFVDTLKRRYDRIKQEYDKKIEKSISLRQFLDRWDRSLADSGTPLLPTDYDIEYRIHMTPGYEDKIKNHLSENRSGNVQDEFESLLQTICNRADSTAGLISKKSDSLQTVNYGSIDLVVAYRESELQNRSARVVDVYTYN